MSSIPAAVTHDEIIWLTGPRFIGILFNWGLLGVLTAQVYVYYVQFPKDSPVNKALVYGLYLCDWAQTCSATYDAFQWFVYGWGDIAKLYGIWTSWLNVPVFGSLIGVVVQLYFAWRIRLIGKSWILPVVISTLAVLQFGGGLATAYYLHTYPFEISRSEGLVRVVGIRLGGSAAADVLIAVSMTYFLLRSRVIAVGHTNTVITRLVRLTIETGSVTALAAIVDLVFFLTVHNGLHQVSGVILGKLYSNTLLVLYNNRAIMAQSKLHSSINFSDCPAVGSFSPRRQSSITELSAIRRTDFEISIPSQTKPKSSPHYVDNVVAEYSLETGIYDIERNGKPET